MSLTMAHDGERPSLDFKRRGDARPRCVSSLQGNSARSPDSRTSCAQSSESDRNTDRLSRFARRRRVVHKSAEIWGMGESASCQKRSTKIEAAKQINLAAPSPPQLAQRLRSALDCRSPIRADGELSRSLVLLAPCWDHICRRALPGGNRDSQGSLASP